MNILSVCLGRHNIDLHIDGLSHLIKSGPHLRFSQPSWVNWYGTPLAGAWGGTWLPPAAAPPLTLRVFLLVSIF